MSFESSMLDILTGKSTFEEVYLKQVDQEIEKKKPLLKQVIINTYYLEALSALLIQKGLLTGEEKEALNEVIEQKAEETLNKQIAEAREEARKSFADEMSKFGDKKESVENGGISSC